MQTININIYDPSSWEKAIKDLEKLKEKIDKCQKDLMDSLKDDGIIVAKQKFDSAIYADNNRDVDVSAKVEKIDSGYRATIVARGDNVGFIEFGTGVNFDFPFHEMPDLEESIPLHGTYGNKGGASPHGWWYKGSPTENMPDGTEQAKSVYYMKKSGRIVVRNRHGWMHTMGSPANSCMHDTYEYLQDIIEKRVKEIFKL